MISNFSRNWQTLPNAKTSLHSKFTVMPLREQSSKATSVPQTAKDWETVFEKALLFRNRYKLGEREKYVINVEKIEEDTADIAKGTIKANLDIHSEVKILLYIFKTENENPSIPKAYNY